MSLSKMTVRKNCRLIPLLFSFGSLDRPLRRTAELRMSDTLERTPCRRITNVVVVRISIDNVRCTTEELWRRAIDQNCCRISHRVHAGAICISAPLVVTIAARLVRAKRVRRANRATAVCACAQDGNGVAGDVANVHAGEFGSRIPVAFDPRTFAVGFAIAYLEIATSLTALLANGASSINGDVGALAGRPRDAG